MRMPTRLTSALRITLVYPQHAHEPGTREHDFDHEESAVADTR